MLDEHKQKDKLKFGVQALACGADEHKQKDKLKFGVQALACGADEHKQKDKLKLELQTRTQSAMAMKPERWKQIDDLLEAAFEHRPEERAAFIDAACAGDEALRREVESLLSADARASRFIERPAAEIAANVLDEKATLPPGQPIAHYRIVSLISRGGMGAVYLAEDLRLGRRVALKLLPDYFTKDEQRVRRFEQEARAASGLNHQNIIVIYDVGVEGDIHIPRPLPPS